MPPSTRRPGRRLRSTAALPTPFWRLTMTTSGGALRAMTSAISAVSALLTVTSTTPASPKTEGFSDSVSRSRLYRLIEAFETRRPQPVGLDFGDHARTRQQGDTATPGRQHAADEAADAAGACHTNGPGRIHSICLFRLLDSVDTRSTVQCLSSGHGHGPEKPAQVFGKDHAPAKATPRPAPCNRHGPPLCFASGG